MADASADASAKALEASVSTDIIGDNSSKNSDKLLSALAQMQTSFQEALSKQTNSLLKFFDEDKGRKSVRKRSHTQDESDDSVSEAPKRAKHPSKTGKTSSGNDQEENEHQRCQSQETDHEVVELFDSGENSQRGRDVDDTLSLFGGPEFNEDEQDNENLLSDIAQSLVSSEDTGPPINDKLASIVNKNFSDDVDLTKLKSILNTHKKPENCTELFVPRVNTEIWHKMMPHQRKADIKFSNLQDTLIKGVSALTTASNDLLVCRETKTLPNYKDFLSQLLDATALFGHVCQELSFKRKETIKPILHPDFKSVCSRTHKVRRLLFGEDLPKVVQDLRASTKVVAQLTSFVPQGNQSEGEEPIPSPKAISTEQKDIHKEIDKVSTQVKDFPKFVDEQLKCYLEKEVSNFQAGQIKKCSHEWSKITSDPDILSIVQGFKSSTGGAPRIVFIFQDRNNYNQTSPYSLIASKPCMEHHIRQLAVCQHVEACTLVLIHFFGCCLRKRIQEPELVLPRKRYEDNFMREVENLNQPRQRRAPERYEEMYVCADDLTADINEPRNISEAWSNEYNTQWKKATDSEFNALMENGTWELVPPPDDKNIVGSRWVFKVKRKADGSVEKFKARLVAQGYSQTEGIDYNEVFSPVVRNTSIRSLLALANILDWEIHQMDVKTAFLQGDLTDEIYMKQPEGYRSKENPDHWLQ
ncbi:Hypothetical predicted protein, partial [Paramuricea clavata]